MSSTKHEEISERLRTIADLRAEHLRLRAEADELAREWVPVAKAAGMTIKDIADQAGYTRKGLYDLLEKTNAR